MRKGILKGLRLLKAVSQKKCAEDLGVSQQTVASWEVGRTEPSNVWLMKIADYFGVTTDDLLGHCHNQKFSDEQIQLLKTYESLNSDGQNLLKGLVESLLKSHSRKEVQAVQQNSGHSTVINVGSNNSATFR